MKTRDKTSTEPYQPRYPQSAEELKTGQRMAHLQSAARTAIAEDTRYLRNAIARSVGAAMAEPLETETEAQRVPYRRANGAANELLTHWFRQDPQYTNLDMYLPHLPMAEYALAKITARTPDGQTTLRFPHMRDERLHAYGIPEDFLPADDPTTTKDRLNLLAWMIGVPPGYLLLQLRVHEVPVKLAGAPPTWMEAPLHDWLRGNLAVALGSLGVEPLADPPSRQSPLRSTLQDAKALQQWLSNQAAITLDGFSVTPLTDLIHPILAPTRVAHLVGRCKPAARTRARVVDIKPEIKPEIKAAFEAVREIQAIAHQVGSMHDFFQVLGGPRSFEARFGFHTSKRFGIALRVPNLPYTTMRRYLQVDVTHQSPAQLNRGARLPALANTHRIKELVELLQPLLPEHGARCTPGQVASITAAVSVATKQRAQTVAKLLGASPGATPTLGG